MIVIDPGHGGADPGASGNGIIEKDYNLLISKYMYNRFRELGIPVSITRDTDITLSPSERVKKVMNAFGNNPNVVVISNHLNAGGGEGAEVIYALRDNDTLSKLITNELSKQGQIIRKYYQRRLPSNPMKDYFFIHRDTGVTEPVIVEYGFMDNINDANKIKNNYKNYAEAVIKAVTQYKKLPYTSPEGLPSIIIENTYTVKPGDTLYSIAKKFGISINEIKRLNNLSNNLVNVNQVLKITEGTVTKTPSEKMYTVKKGDSLYIIANANNITVDEIKKLNSLSSNLINVGQTLLLPVAKTAPTSDMYYTVKSGDNLYDIANKYNTTVNEIKRLNNLSSNLLNIGQRLKIPSNLTSTERYHIVKSGDNLYDIARRYNTTVNEIKRLNNLSSNLLNIGQRLKIQE